jgi:hypothetical protein
VCDPPKIPFSRIHKASFQTLIAQNLDGKDNLKA